MINPGDRSIALCKEEKLHRLAFGRHLSDSARVVFRPFRPVHSIPTDESGCCAQQTAVLGSLNVRNVKLLRIQGKYHHLPVNGTTRISLPFCVSQNTKLLSNYHSKLQQSNFVLYCWWTGVPSLSTKCGKSSGQILACGHWEFPINVPKLSEEPVHSLRQRFPGYECTKEGQGSISYCHKSMLCE
ncbi:hypothetical protein PM082_017643 [Marasmius tenuissimus]|nr:hypothetical protein PM082_017643 [Marasmius tenuissimus]